ncbi:MAG TPA: oxygenase MpaB family protein [Puia sp.]|nr:oxygenase MpaB family protein [Puia sp.]
MEYFVDENSIVRKIWSKSETILFIFAGSAAEFALNKAVDWLYFTGKLPADPIGRLFSTVTYARQIVFFENEKALAAIDKIRSIHGEVEKNRKANIPAWAYRDVLFMLIHYSISSFELLERKLTADEKQEVYAVFYRLGTRMELTNLPSDYAAWLPVREEHLLADLEKSKYSIDLFKQYKKHLGIFRYYILKESQKLVAPKRVSELLHFGKFSILTAILPFYKLAGKLKVSWIIKKIILPRKYILQIKNLDVVPSR